MLVSHDEERRPCFYNDGVDYNAPTVPASSNSSHLSGNADRSELLEYAEQTEARAIILTHGRSRRTRLVSNRLKERHPKQKVIDPKPLFE